MSRVSSWAGDIYVQGNLRADSFSFPSLSIRNADAAADAAFATTKLMHRHHVMYQQESAATAADASHIIYVAQASGTITQFRAGAKVAHIGAAVCTFDLKKNGTTVLSAVIETDSGDVAYAVVPGTISSTTYTADDVFEIVVDATVGGGTLATGVFAQVVFDESAT